MLGTILVSIHYLAVFTWAFSILFKLVTFNKSVSALEAKQIRSADILVSLSAGAVLTSGLLRLFYVEKDNFYYFDNPLYYLMLSIFLVIAIFSIYPAARFSKWNNYIHAGVAPIIEDKEFSRIRWFLRLELMGLFVIFLVASLVEKGVWF